MVRVKRATGAFPQAMDERRSDDGCYRFSLWLSGITLKETIGIVWMILVIYALDQWTLGWRRRLRVEQDHVRPHHLVVFMVDNVAVPDVVP